MHVYTHNTHAYISSIVAKESLSLLIFGSVARQIFNLISVQTQMFSF